MASISQIRSNLHNKIRMINRQEIFHTPYKPLVTGMTDNKQNQSVHSFRELKTAAKSFRMSNTSTQDKPIKRNIEAFEVKYVQMPKHKCRSEIGNRADRAGELIKPHDKKSSDMNSGDTALLPNIELKRIRRRAKTRSKKKSKLFKIDSKHFYDKIEEITKQYKHYIQE